MIAFLFNMDAILSNPLMLIFMLFAVWMLVDAIRREEWLWAVFIFLFPPLNSVLYFFLVYRQAASFSSEGFQIPGAHDRRRIRELEGQIAHLDKAHLYLELGDIYFRQGKLEKAYESYQKALERDPEDPDVRGHLGQCLLQMKRAQEARALLEQVCAQDPKHDYGQSMMALAEAYIALDQPDAAIQALQRVLQEYSYARARVQLAALYFKKGEAALAKAELNEVINDDASAPEFQRKRDRVWVKRAKQMMGSAS